MSFAGLAVPSLSRSTALRAFGAPGFTGASSFRRTAAITRMVAVACTATLGGGEDVETVASAAAAIRNMNNANAGAGKW